MVHAAPESFYVVADVRDHSVPFISLRGHRLVIRAPCGSVAVGGRVRSGAHRPPVPPKAVSDDTPAIFHPKSFQEILKVLAVLFRNEGSEAFEKWEERK